MGSLTAMQCVQNVYKREGMPGFYKGITASYYGIAETVIHFVIYEAIKAKLREYKGKHRHDTHRTYTDFLEFMGAGATSKTIATCVAYPHGRSTIFYQIISRMGNRGDSDKGSLTFLQA